MIFTDLKIPSRSAYLFRPQLLSPLPTTYLFYCVHSLYFPKCHIVGVTQYAASLDWLLSLSNIHLSLLHAFLWFDSLFLFSTT